MVVVDHRFVAFLAHRASCFFGAEGGHAVADHFALLRADADDVTALEVAFDFGDADGQQAGGAFGGGEGVDGALVDDDGPFFQPFAVRDPPFAALFGFLREELRAGFFAPHDGLQNAGGGAVGDVHGDAEA